MAAIADRARVLFETYIKDGARLQVNVSFQVQQSIGRAVTDLTAGHAKGSKGSGGTCGGVAAFDVARKEVLQILADGSFRRFQVALLTEQAKEIEVAASREEEDMAETKQSGTSTKKGRGGNGEAGGVKGATKKEKRAARKAASRLLRLAGSGTSLLSGNSTVSQEEGGGSCDVAVDSNPWAPRSSWLLPLTPDLLKLQAVLASPRATLNASIDGELVRLAASLLSWEAESASHNVVPKEEKEDTVQLSTPLLSISRGTVFDSVSFTPRKECVYRCWTRSATSKIDPAMAALARAYPFVCDKYVVEDSYIIWPRDGMISRPDIHQLKPGQEIYCLYTNTRIASPSTSQVPL